MQVIMMAELFLKLANSTSPSWFASRTQAADGLSIPREIAQHDRSN